MKREFDGPSPAGLLLYRFLIVLVGLAVAAIVLATAIALAAGKPGTVRRTAGAAAASDAVAPANAVAPGNTPAAATAPKTETATYTRIGQLRVASASSPPATVIVSVVFPYDRDDQPFYEELVSRNQDFRSIARDFFSSRTTQELRTSDAEELKRLLLERFNAQLRLGKIAILYLDEYLIID